MSLLHDLLKLGDTISPSELPPGGDRAVGALIKVLEHGGTTVADELFPAADVAQVAAVAAPAVTEEATKALEALLRRFEGAVTTVEAKASGETPVGQPVVVNTQTADEDPQAVITALQAELDALKSAQPPAAAPATPTFPPAPAPSSTGESSDPDAPSSGSAGTPAS